MCELRVPIIATVIGEGGSGGALAIGVADKVNMLEYSTYSVISPEGCASILWKDSANAKDAAQAMGITARRLKKLSLIDNIITEPRGGAHRSPEEMSQKLKATLTKQLKELQKLSTEQILDERYQRLMSVGNFQ